MRSEASRHQPDSMSFKSRIVLRTNRAERSPVETFPLGTPVSPFGFPLNALQSWRARSKEEAGLRTRMRSARYCWNDLRSSGVTSRSKRVIVPPEMNTALIALVASETPEERRSGRGLETAACV